MPPMPAALLALLGTAASALIVPHQPRECKGAHRAYMGTHAHAPGACTVYCVPEGRCESYLREGVFSDLGSIEQGHCGSKGFTAAAALDEASRGKRELFETFTGPCKGMSLTRYERPPAAGESVQPLEAHRAPGLARLSSQKSFLGSEMAGSGEEEGIGKAESLEALEDRAAEERRSASQARARAAADREATKVMRAALEERRVAEETRILEGKRVLERAVEEREQAAEERRQALEERRALEERIALEEKRAREARRALAERRALEERRAREEEAEEARLVELMDTAKHGDVIFGGTVDQQGGQMAFPGEEDDPPDEEQLRQIEASRAGKPEDDKEQHAASTETSEEEEEA